MEIIEKHIAELKEYANNPRNIDGAVDAVAQSIIEFGFKVPIIIDSGGVIVAGHVRKKAAEQLGLDKVPCIVADDLTPEQIKAFRLADNKTGELAEWDFDALEKELSELTAFDVDMAAFGFDESIFDMTDEIDLQPAEKGKLTDRFVVPPFSVLDSTQGYWTERKRLWRERINDNAEARAGAKAINQIWSSGQSFNEVSLLDPVLSEIIVKWFTPKEENGINCFDVFAGDTVFGFVSAYMGKKFRGIELRQEQADFNNERCMEYDLDANYICDDGRNVLKHFDENSQDLLFSCPPYFDLEVYSNDDRDASNKKTYADFFGVLDAAFTNAIKCLKDNRFAVIVVGDIRNKTNGCYYDFCGDIKRCFAKNGMELYNELILVNPYGTAAIRAGKYMRSRKVAKVHQNVLVFYKGDTAKIKECYGEIDFDEVGINAGENE